MENEKKTRIHDEFIDNNGVPRDVNAYNRRHYVKNYDGGKYIITVCNLILDKSEVNPVDVYDMRPNCDQCSRGY